ncbi:MAG TPA: hypothetical protein VK709_21565 [Candidatus Saccharimonadales bacterium]|jgi:hypothetical protein|nr:hypothetical protein [Candidatus Saccharimonadales bacterium]
MKIKKIVREFLTIALIYGALTLIIAGGFALSMGFAMAATPNAPNLPEVQNSSPTSMSLAHTSFTDAPASDSLTSGK